MHPLDPGNRGERVMQAQSHNNIIPLCFRCYLRALLDWSSKASKGERETDAPLGQTQQAGRNYSLALLPGPSCVPHWWASSTQPSVLIPMGHTHSGHTWTSTPDSVVPNSLFLQGGRAGPVGQKGKASTRQALTLPIHSYSGGLCTLPSWPGPLTQPSRTLHKLVWSRSLT